MKRNDEQYEQWLEKLRDTMPVLSDPDKLALDILRAVDHLPQKVRKRNGRGWKIMSWLSATAAGFLLCLLLSETAFFSGSGEMEQQVITSTNVSVMKQRFLYPFPQCEVKGLSLQEKSLHLSAIWRSRQEAERKRKKVLYEILSSYKSLYQ